MTDSIGWLMLRLRSRPDGDLRSPEHRPFEAQGEQEWLRYSLLLALRVSEDFKDASRMPFGAQDKLALPIAHHTNEARQVQSQHVCSIAD